MAVLALDIATQTGFAVEADGKLSSGSWNLKPPAKSCDKTRELTFFRKLEALWADHGSFSLVAFEAVYGHSRSDEKKVTCPRCMNKFQIKVQQVNTLAAQVYGGLRGTMLMWADFHSVRVEGVAVGTLKKFATGHGHATKDDMIAMAEMRWREQKIVDDNQADALHILDWALVEVLRRHQKQSFGPTQLPLTQ